jgi:hypothetical protein
VARQKNTNQGQLVLIQASENFMQRSNTKIRSQPLNKYLTSGNFTEITSYQLPVSTHFNLLELFLTEQGHGKQMWVLGSHSIREAWRSAV